MFLAVGVVSFSHCGKVRKQGGEKVHGKNEEKKIEMECRENLQGRRGSVL